MAGGRQLRRQALESAKWRGHDMGRWEVITGHLCRSTCKKCSKEVDVNTKPAPNEIDIGGEAVALGCEN